MKTHTNYIKVRAHLTINFRSEKFPQEFIDKLTDADEKFRSKIIIPINAVIGLHNWAVDFIENPMQGYFVDVHCNDLICYSKITQIVRDRIPEEELSFRYCGNIEDYVAA